MNPLPDPEHGKNFTQLQKKTTKWLLKNVQKKSSDHKKGKKID